MPDAHTDQPQLTRFAGERRHRKQDREQREDREAEVVGADAAEHVPQTAERGNEYRQHDQVAENHPQQVVRIARRQRIDVDAAEDVG